MREWFEIAWIVLRQVVWPDGFANKVNRIVGALSVLALVSYSFDVGFGPVLLRLLEYYDQFVCCLLCWTEQYIEVPLKWLRARLNIDLVLYPHWKHILVLLGVYCFRSARSEFDLGYVRTGVFYSFLGLVIAPLVGIWVGTMPLVSGNMWAHFRIVAVPIGGLFLYDFVAFLWRATFTRKRTASAYGQSTPSWWADFSARVTPLVRRSLLGLALALFALLVPAVSTLKSPGLAILGGLVFVLGLYWLWAGFTQMKALRAEGAHLRAALLRSGRIHTGAAMLGTYFWCLFYLAPDVALSLYGG